MEAWRHDSRHGHRQRFHFRRRVHQRGHAPESIKVTDDSGKPIDNITLRVGESKNLKVTILPDAASQEYTASIKDVSLASVRQQ